MVTTPPCSSDGLTIREASAALRLSPTTVRRRIKAGELPARELPTTQGHEWRVFLDGGQVPTAGEHVATARRGVGDQVPTSGDQMPPAGELSQPGVRAYNQDGHGAPPRGQASPSSFPVPPGASYFHDVPANSTDSVSATGYRRTLNHRWPSATVRHMRGDSVIGAAPRRGSVTPPGSDGA